MVREWLALLQAGGHGHRSGAPAAIPIPTGFESRLAPFSDPLMGSVIMCASPYVNFP